MDLNFPGEAIYLFGEDQKALGRGKSIALVKGDGISHDSLLRGEDLKGDKEDGSSKGIKFPRGSLLRIFKGGGGD